jgi:hypothetical protein
MELYRITVLRKGWPVWDGTLPAGPHLVRPLISRATPEQLASLKSESDEFLKTLPTLGRVIHYVPTDDEIASGFGIRSEYAVRRVWEKDQLLVWFNKIFATRIMALDPSLVVVARSHKI